MEKKIERKFKFQIEPKKEGGVYSNIATVVHSETEFLVDFGMFLPGRDAIRVGSRIILSPRTAKQLLLALKSNIETYESRFGEIKLPSVSHHYPPGTPEIAQ